MRASKLLIAVTMVVCAGSHGTKADLLTPAFETQLADWLGEGSLTYTNIFTKSSGNVSSDFHAAVDGKGRTFTLIEVLNPPGGGDPQIIGGFNPQSWDSHGHNHITEDNADRNAFIYNLSTPTPVLLTQGHGVPGDEGRIQTFNHTLQGPTFGGGNDIFVPTDLTFGGYTHDFSYGDVGQNGDNLFGVLVSPGLTYGAIEVYTFIPAPGAALLAMLGLPMIGWAKRRLR